MQMHTNTCLYAFQPMSVWMGFQVRYRHVSQIQAYTCKCIHIRINTGTYELPPDIHARINVIYTYTYIYMHI